MRRPSFQFYPGDWQRNANLRRCSPAARGVWLDVMCLLHDSDEYGVLRWPIKEIAQACGASMSHVRELVDKSVLKGSDRSLAEPFIYIPRSGRRDGTPVTLLPVQDGPIWYSSRMVKDEYVRENAGAATRFGAGQSEDKPARHAKNGTNRAKLRQRVLEKTGGSCYHCDTQLGEVWEVDHLMPRSKGGRHTFANLVPSCVACNQDKSDTLPDDWAALMSSPTRRHGDGEGDGPTSSSSSATSVSPSSLRSEGGAAKAPPPPPAARKAREQITLTAYLALCKASGVKPIADDHAIRRWCADAGIGPEMLQVAWVLFRERYTEDEKAKGKRYKDWSGVFGNAVKGNWFKLWFAGDDGALSWTTIGMTHKAALDARVSQREAAHG